MAYCKQCGNYMDPAEAILSRKYGVCGKCCRENHKKTIGSR